MRYHTKNGIAISPYEMGCERPTIQRGITQNHHNQWPRGAYTETHERIFRGLVSNVYPLLIPDHMDIHTYQPPKKPTNAQMIDRVEDYLDAFGIIDVVREKRTNETYQVTATDWHQIIKRVRG